MLKNQHEFMGDLSHDVLDIFSKTVSFIALFDDYAFVVFILLM